MSRAACPSSRAPSSSSGSDARAGSSGCAPIGETGGVRGAVGRLAEAAYARLSEPQQAIARSVFLRLAADDEQIVRRRVALSEFDVETDPDLRQVISVLTDARLLSIDDDTVEVSHEALLREWPRLVEWLDEDQEGRRLRHHLADSAHEWDARGRDPGELYRGARLASALEWTVDHGTELNSLERTFVAESRASSERDADRQRRINRRLRVLLAAAGVALILAVGAGGLALVQRGEAERAAADAESHRQAAEAATRIAVAQRVGAQALNVDELDVSLLLARQAVALDDSRETEATLLGALLRSPAAIGVSHPLAGRLNWVDISPDGVYVTPTTIDGQTAIIRTGDRQLQRPIDGGFAGFSSDGHALVLEFGPLRLQLQDPTSNALEGQIRYPDAWQAFSWAPDLTTYTVLEDDHRTVTMYDGRKALAGSPGVKVGQLTAPADRTILDVWQVHGGLLTVDHVGSVAPGGDVSGQPVMFDWWPTGSTTPTVSVPAEAQVTPFAVDPSGRMLALGHADGTLTLTDLTSGEDRTVTGRHTGAIRALAFSPDGTRLVTASADRTVKVWDGMKGELLDTLAGHADEVSGVAISDAGGHLTAYSVGYDGLLIAWDLTGDRRLGRPLPAEGPVEGAPPPSTLFVPAVVPVPGTPTVLAPTADGRIAVIDTARQQSTNSVAVSQDYTPVTAAVSPDGKRVLVGGVGRTGVRVWDPASWTPDGNVLPGPLVRTNIPPYDADPSQGSWPNTIRAVAFSPDGSFMAAGGDDGMVYLWNRDGTPYRVPKLDTSGGAVLGLAFSPDSTAIAAVFDLSSLDFTSRSDGLAQAWRLTDSGGSAAGSPLFTAVQLGRDFGRAAAVAYSPDGRLLVTGGGDGEVRFWDPTTGVEVGRRVPASSGGIISLSFDPAGDLLVAGSADGTIQLIDVSSRQLFGARLPSMEGIAATATFTGSGADLSVITRSASGSGAIWSVSPAEWETGACAIAGRPLDQEEWDRYITGGGAAGSEGSPLPYAPACR